MGVPAAKVCASCGRTITWRKKWATDWESVRYCSKACRRVKVSPTDHLLEHTILTLLDGQPRGATIALSQAVHAAAGGQVSGGGEALMQPARAAARRLSARGDVEILHGGRVVDPSTARGDLRIRRLARP